MIELAEIEDPQLWYGTIAAKAIEITQRDTGLSVSQIADCIPTSKVTLYRWLSGGCPNLIAYEGLCVVLARVRDGWQALQQRA